MYPSIPNWAGSKLKRMKTTSVSSSNKMIMLITLRTTYALMNLNSYRFGRCSSETKNFTKTVLVGGCCAPAHQFNYC